jgi:hypothetical protein
MRGQQATCPCYPAKHGCMDQLATCEISKKLHPKWGKLLWLKEISKKNSDPEKKCS